MWRLAVPYVLLVALFYHKSDGFVKFNDALYPLWKTLPVLVLSLLQLVMTGDSEKNKTDLEKNKMKMINRRYTAAGLFFGAVGDYLLATIHNGVVWGAIVFGMGHICYLITFAHLLHRLSWPLLIVNLVWGGFVQRLTLLPMFYTDPLSATILLLYSLLLSAVFLISGSLYLNGSTVDKPMAKNNLVRFIGFFFFYCSDSALIFNHTGYHIPYAELLILTLYFSAQYMIAWGNWISTGVETKKIHRN